LTRAGAVADRPRPRRAPFESECRRRSARRPPGFYAGAPNDQRMFAAGYPSGPENAVSAALIDALVVSGIEGEIAAALRQRLESGQAERLLNLAPSDDERADEDAIFRVIASL